MTDQPFHLTTTKPMDNEHQLINVAAWLWEAEDMIWAEMQANGYESMVEDLATRGAAVWRFAGKTVRIQHSGTTA